MKDKLVSVVIPTFKRPKMLCRVIDSVLNQTYANVEIIIVDDNNPNTQERIETEILMKQYSEEIRIIYIKHETNRNGSAARNTGWKAASGEYITFVDDDDEISPLKIQKQVECLESLDKSWGACYTAYHVLMENGSVQRSQNTKYGNVYLEALMRTFYVGSGSNLLLRKKVVDEIQGYDESFLRNQDIEFMVRVFENYKVAFVNEDLLTIHWEVRTAKRSYEFIDEISNFYLFKMNVRLNKLSANHKHKVMAVISLDRARVAFYYKRYFEIFKILRDNHVTFFEICKYLFYLFKRVITKKSYGFNLD